MSLQKIHDIVKNKWFSGAIFTVISLAFMLWGVSFYLHDGAGASDAAVVGGTKISAAAVNDRYQIILRQNPKLVSSSPAEQQQLKQAALNSLINEQLVLSTANQLGLAVSPQQVSQVVLQIPAFQENGRFSPQRLQQFLMNSNLSQEQFAQQLSDSLLTSQLSSFFQLSNFALPNEVQSAYQLTEQQRDFSLVSISAKPFMTKVIVSDRAIMNFYQQNQAQFSEPEKVKIDYIEVSPKSILDKLNISDAAAKQYYENNIADYRSPQQWMVQRIGVNQAKMAEIVAKLKQGVPFEKLYANNNGKQMLINAAQLDDEEIAALNQIKPNQLTQAINVAGVEVLYRLIEAKPLTTKPFAQVATQVKNLLKQQAANTQLAELNNQLSNVTYTNPNTLAPAAKQLKLELLHSDWFARDGAKTGIAADPAVVAAAFSDDVLVQGNNSTPVTLKEGSVIVLRVVQHTPSQALPLEQVKNKIHAILQLQLAQAQAALLANKMLLGLQAKKSLNVLAQENHLRVQMEHGIKADTKQFDAAIVSQVFQLSAAQPFALLALPSGDSALVYLHSVHMGDFTKATAKEKQQISDAFALGQAKQVAGLYMNGRQQAAKVKILLKNS